MRLEHAGPRTRLLAVLAALALLAWFAALAGAGSRVAPLPDDPSLLPPLPSADANAAPALGPMADYAVIGERPLLSIDRRPRPFYLAGAGEEPGSRGFDYELTSVILSPGLRMAILQPTGGGDSVRVREGTEANAAPGWRLVALGRRSATFEGPEGRRELGLRVFNGSGREATPAVPGDPPVAEAADAAADADQGGVASAAAPGPDQGPDAEAAVAPSPDTAQVEAIRQRIQARRARLQKPESQ